MIISQLKVKWNMFIQNKNKPPSFNWYVGNLSNSVSCLHTLYLHVCINNPICARCILTAQCCASSILTKQNFTLVKTFNWTMDSILKNTSSSFPLPVFKQISSSIPTLYSLNLLRNATLPAENLEKGS